MSGIQGKNTKPEMAVRRGLHKLGFRYRLHQRKLPGRPDLVFTKYRAVIFVNGCFWHRHDCSGFRLPQTRTEFWHAKLERNIERDKSVRLLLEVAGWRHLTVWECELKLHAEETILKSATWLRGVNSGTKFELL